MCLRSAVHFKRDGRTRVKLGHYGDWHLEESHNFIAGCPLDTVQRFVIKGGFAGEVTDDRTSRTMLSLRNVENLVLKNATYLLPLLLHTTEDGVHHFPMLKTLEIDDDEIPQELVLGLKVRTEAGLPLQRIILRAERFEVASDELLQFVEDVEYG